MYSHPQKIHKYSHLEICVTSHRLRPLLDSLGISFVCITLPVGKPYLRGDFFLWLDKAPLKWRLRQLPRAEACGRRLTSRATGAVANALPAKVVCQHLLGCQGAQLQFLPRCRMMSAFGDPPTSVGGNPAGMGDIVCDGCHRHIIVGVGRNLLAVSNTLLPCSGAGMS